MLTDARAATALFRPRLRLRPVLSQLSMNIHLRRISEKAPPFSEYVIADFPRQVNRTNRRKYPDGEGGGLDTAFSFIQWQYTETGDPSGADAPAPLAGAPWGCGVFATMQNLCREALPLLGEVPSAHTGERGRHRGDPSRGEKRGHTKKKRRGRPLCRPAIPARYAAHTPWLPLTRELSASAD